jgi:hypothetical protein
MPIKSCNGPIIRYEYNGTNEFSWIDSEGIRHVIHTTESPQISDPYPHTRYFWHSDYTVKLEIEKVELQIKVKRLENALHANYNYDFIDRRTMMQLVLRVGTMDIKKIRMLLGTSYELLRLKENHLFQKAMLRYLKDFYSSFKCFA